MDTILIAWSLCLGVVSSVDVQYHLYRRSDVHKVLLNDNSLSSSAAEYQPSLMTYFIIHGWNDAVIAKWSQQLKAALLKNEDANVIFTSWKDAENRDYFHAKAYTPAVGKDVASFITRLEELFTADRRRMHLIGHSLGAQVAGSVGANLQTPTKVARISALDASFVGYDCEANKGGCLDPSDADFVDEINTLTGLQEDGGAHAEFYPVPKHIFKIILGKNKSGFANGIVGAHFLACDYFTKSIEAGQCAFKAVACDSLKNFWFGKCNKNEQNNLGFYARKPSKYPVIQAFFLKIDVDAPCKK